MFFRQVKGVEVGGALALEPEVAGSALRTVSRRANRPTREQRPRQERAA